MESVSTVRTPLLEIYAKGLPSPSSPSLNAWEGGPDEGLPPRSPRFAAPQPTRRHPAFFSAPVPHRVERLRELNLRAAARRDTEGLCEATVVNMLDGVRELVAAGDSARSLVDKVAALRAVGGGLPGAIRHLEDTAAQMRHAARQEKRWGVMNAALDDALARLEKEDAAAGAASGEFPFGSFNAGLQLLPQTAVRYRMPWAEWFIAFDALSLGWLGRRFLKTVRHARVYLRKNWLPPREARGDEPARPAQNYTTFCPVLEPRASFDATFDSRTYLKQMSVRWVAWCLAAIFVILGFDAVACGLNSFLGPAANPFLFLNQFLFAVIDDIRGALLGNVPSFFTFTIFGCVFSLLWGVLYIILVISRSEVATFVNVRPADLPSLLSLVLRTNVPVLMVSYTWQEPYVDVARSLASACPNAWVDVQTLASGVDIPHTTASVSRWSFAQVVFLSENYLGSRACLLEFFTALLRRQAWQHLVVYYDHNYGGAVTKDTLDLLREFGCIVVETPEELLEKLENCVYSCGKAAVNKDYAKRCVDWWSRVGLPNEAVPRQMLLPAPAMKRQPRFNLSGRLFPPHNAICAGNAYITADGRGVGALIGVNVELLYAIFSVAAYLLAVSFFFVAVQQVEAAGKPFYWGTKYFMPVLLFGAFLLFILAAYPLQVLTDHRNYHSGILLPLNLAAIVDGLDVRGEGEERATKYKVFFFVSELKHEGMSESERLDGSKNEWEDLHATINNTARFLRDSVGLSAENCHWEPGSGAGGQPAAAPWDTAENKGVIKLVVFVIRSKAAAAEYVAHWKGRVPAACSVLVADFRCTEGSELRLKMLITLGPLNGLSDMSAYSEEGLVTAMLDSLGAKVGAAFVMRTKV